MRARSFVLAVSVVLVLGLAGLPLAPDGGPTGGPQNGTGAVARPADQYTVDRTSRKWPVRVVFVGYDDAVVNESEFVAGLPGPFERSYGSLHVVHNISYEVYFAGATYYNWVLEWARGHAHTGSAAGTRLDTTQLDPDTPDPSTFLVPRAGMAINATATEDWLYWNPYVPGRGDGWTLYVLNLSELDTPDHSYEHWFEYTPLDVDSNTTRPLHLPVVGPDTYVDATAQLTAFGGRYDLYTVDPSADQWYLRLAAALLNGTLYDGRPPRYMTEDLEDVVVHSDLSTAAGRANVTQYLAEYCSALLHAVFMSDAHGDSLVDPPPTWRPTVSLVQLRVTLATVGDTSSAGDLGWMTAASRVREALTHAVPVVDWDVYARLLPIDEESTLNSTFWGAVTLNDTDVVVDCTRLAMGLAGGSDHSGGTTDNESVLSLNVSVFVGAGLVPMEACGLGTAGLTAVVTRGLDTVVGPGPGDPVAGVTGDIVRAVLALLGVGCSLNTSLFIGDMMWGVLTPLFPAAVPSTATTDILCVALVDQLEEASRDLLRDVVSGLPATLPSRTAWGISSALRAIRHADDLVLRHDFQDAVAALLSVEDWAHRIVASLSDSLRPEILEWGVVQPHSWDDPFVVWANVSESGSGIENVTVVIEGPLGERRHLLPYNGTHYTAWLAPLGLNATFQVHVEAYDWAMNVATSYTLTVDLSPRPPPPLDPWVTMPLVVGSSLVLMVVVVVVAYAYRRRVFPEMTAGPPE